MAELAKLLDTSTLSEVMKKRDPGVERRAREYLEAHGRFTFSILTRFEVLRGLYAKKAESQIERFESLCAMSEILPLTDPIVVKGAQIYAELRDRGRMIDDADILIAATAMVSGLSLVTENLAHFERVPDLECESWRTPKTKPDSQDA